jgi:hypothetical protein
LYEQGGVYDGQRIGDARPLDLGERSVCCRCGTSFVATEASTPEENRDRHVAGDAECPSVCKHRDKDKGQ